MSGVSCFGFLSLIKGQELKKVSIFLNQCLPLSEIFVYHQTAALERYEPQFLACRHVKGVAHDIPTTAINTNNTVPEKCAELLFKATGINKTLQDKVKNSDLVHAHFGPTGWLASHLTHKTGKPLIVTLHGFDITKDKITIKQDGALQALYSQKRNILAQRASTFICVSNYMKDKAINFGFPEEKCQVHYMGIPLHEHTTPKAQWTKGEPVRILSVGRLVPFKAHAKLIEAVSHLQKDGVDIHLDMIGDGPLRETLEKQAQRSLKNYTFHGALPHGEVLAMMRRAHLYVHTSMTQENGQTEAFGLVLLEAQWAGLPVAAFSTGGVPEALSDRKTGFLCEEGDVSALAQNIRDIITTEGLMDSMSSDAPNFIKQNFFNKMQTKKLEEIYDEVLPNFKK